MFAFLSFNTPALDCTHRYREFRIRHFPGLRLMGVLACVCARMIRFAFSHRVHGAPLVSSGAPTTGTVHVGL